MSLNDAVLFGTVHRVACRRKNSRMPQFIADGPVVPDKLVQDLEDDKVVLFCGAGVSMGAGLPSYAGLVEFCYNKLRHPLPTDEKEWDWPDRMLTALEARFGPEQVRPLVSRRLSMRPRTLPVHEAILRLAQLRRADGLRFVTTNFDTFFERAAKGMNIKYPWHAGPMLPLPRNDHVGSWRSAVYLHGRLGSSSDLVLNSADFGKAYLTDAWAARFVARLFAEFTVLFVGYSLNDPVLRYMTDAFAAEAAAARTAIGQGPAYIFVSYKNGEVPAREFYEHRNLVPIFYSEGIDRSHAELRETLSVWAKFRDDALSSVSGLIRGIAPKRPDAINPTDTSNLLWAVLERPKDNGHGAHAFATSDPAPPLQWFEEFERRERETLTEYENECAKADKLGRERPLRPERHFGMLFQPVDSAQEERLSPVALGLFEWLVRHTDNLGLVERVIEKRRAGLQLHPGLRRRIRMLLDDGEKLPAALHLFWRIVTTEGIGLQSVVRPELAHILLKNIAPAVEGPWLKYALFEACRPAVNLSSSFDWPDAAEDKSSSLDRLSKIVDADVELSAGRYVRHAAEEAISKVSDYDFWADALDGLTYLLRQSLDLFVVVEKAKVGSDPSLYQRPSIIPHVQNRNHRDWTVLFDLLWHAWKQVDGKDHAKSRACVFGWHSQPYPAFRRLALAAIRCSARFTERERLEMLVDG